MSGKPAKQKPPKRFAKIAQKIVAILAATAATKASANSVSLVQDCPLNQQNKQVQVLVQLGDKLDKFNQAVSATDEKHLANLTLGKNEKYRDVIEKAVRKYHLDPAHLLALINTEAAATSNGWRSDYQKHRPKKPDGVADGNYSAVQKSANALSKETATLVMKNNTTVSNIENNIIKDKLKLKKAEEKLAKSDTKNAEQNKANVEKLKEQLGSAEKELAKAKTNLEDSRARKAEAKAYADWVDSLNKGQGLTQYMATTFAGHIQKEGGTPSEVQLALQRLNHPLIFHTTANV